MHMNHPRKTAARKKLRAPAPSPFRGQPFDAFLADELRDPVFAAEFAKARIAGEEKRRAGRPPTKATGLRQMRFDAPQEVASAIRAAAVAEDRSVANWLLHAVRRQLAGA